MKPLLLIALSTFLLFSGCAERKPLPKVDAPDYAVDLEPVDFKKEVWPILESQCLRCHHEKTDVAFSMESRKSILAASSGGRSILVPGNPEKSTLYLVTQLPEYFVEAMPADGHRLTEAQSTLLYRWILEGAPWPEN